MSDLSTKLKILIVVVVSSTLGVLVSVLALIWSMPDLPTTVITDEICLPDGSDKLRCGKTVKRLLQYTQSQIETELKVLNKDYEDYVKQVNDVDNEHYAELKGFVEQGYIDRKPAARLVMKEDLSRKKREASTNAASSKSNITMIPIKEWETGRDLRDDGGFLRFGMLCNDGRIMVPVTGTYCLSSYADISTKPGSNGKSFKHALYKYNIKENKETELVSNLQPKQNSTLTYLNEQSSFLTSLVKLTSGEEVLVKLSNNADLPNHVQNHLAVYLI